MKIMVKIDQQENYYDLERVHSLSDMLVGQFIIIKHPETHELCRAEVVMKHENGISVRDAADDIAPYQWFIRKSSLFNQVFLIKKQYKNGG